MTGNLEARIWQHKTDVFPGFSRKYGCTTLAWYEMHDDIHEAIARNKRINEWRDLFDELLAIPDSSLSPEARGMNLQGPGSRLPWASSASAQPA